MPLHKAWGEIIGKIAIITSVFYNIICNQPSEVRVGKKYSIRWLCILFFHLVYGRKGIAD